MAIEINTVVSVGETFGKNKVPPITLEDAKFFGRPNFSGVEDAFKDTRRKFTVLIPNDVADQLRDLGYNVKTKLPTKEELAEYPDREMISHLKVMIDLTLSDIFIKMGDDYEKLNANTMGVLDKARIIEMSMELRAWEFNPEEKPGEYSARLVSLVAVIQRNRLSEKYGIPI
jgi:hypothetical protein